MKTNSDNATLIKENSTLKNRVVELELLVKHYEERLLLNRKKEFGSSSEKSCYDQIELDIFNEAEATDAIVEKVSKETTVKEHIRKKTSFVEKFPDDIETEEQVIELSEEDRACPECGETMARIGTEEARNEYVLIPAKVKIRKYRTSSYACKRCERKEISVPIKKSVAPAAVIKGSNASPEAVAHIMTQKFTMGIPFYRQEQDWGRQGVMISRQTMANSLIRCSDDWFLPIWEELKSKMVKGDILHADETTIQVLKEPGKTPQSKSCMWEYRTGKYADEHIVLFEYKPNKRAINAENFLQDFSGYLHTDGNESYHKLPNEVISVGCWAHLRRRFDESVQVIRAEDRKGTDALKGKQYCDRLFEIERDLENLLPDERYKRRKELLEPEMDEFFAWIATVKARPKSKLGGAVGYAISQKKYLRNVLLDGRLVLSNNLAERTIKSFVICRKNFLFANTPKGAAASAVVFSLIETAKAEGLNPYDYLLYVLKNAPRLDMSDEDSVRSLLPSTFKNTFIS